MHCELPWRAESLAGLDATGTRVADVKQRYRYFASLDVSPLT
jgi:hypothetical protein